MWVSGEYNIQKGLLPTHKQPPLMANKLGFLFSPFSNVTFWIEGVHTEDLVEYWPEWIYLKNNEGYFDPKEVSTDNR